MVQSQEEVNSIFKIYLIELFQTCSPSQEALSKVTNSVPSKVTEEMNTRVQSPFNREDIEVVLK